jgi:hypothetical protein
MGFTSVDMLLLVGCEGDREIGVVNVGDTAVVAFARDGIDGMEDAADVGLIPSAGGVRDGETPLDALTRVLMLIGMREGLREGMIGGVTGRRAGGIVARAASSFF